MSRKKKEILDKPKKITKTLFGYMKTYIELIALNGCSSKQAFRIICPERAYRRSINEYLLENGMIKKSEQSLQIRSMTTDGQKMTKRRIVEEYYKLYHIQWKREELAEIINDDLIDTAIQTQDSVHTTNESTISRALRSSELYAVFIQSGIQINISDIDMEKSVAGYFISSKEIKLRYRKANNAAYTANKSRCYGVAGIRSVAYLVYDLNKQNYLKLENSFEAFFKEAVGDVLHQKTDRRIIFCYKESMLSQIIDRTAPKVNGMTKGGKPVVEYESMFDQGDFTVSLLYCKTSLGAKRFRETLIDRTKKQLDHMCGVDKLQKTDDVICDGVTEKNGRRTYYLNFLLPDVCRLRSFLKAADSAALLSESDTKRDYIIYCYREYGEAIKKINNNVTIRVTN